MMHADFDAGCWTAGVRRLPLIPQPYHASSSCGGRVAVESVNIAPSIVSLDWPFDNLGLLSEKFREMLLYVVGSQMHRLISTSLVLKHADGRALAIASIKPIITHKPL